MSEAENLSSRNVGSFFEELTSRFPAGQWWFKVIREETPPVVWEQFAALPVNGVSIQGIIQAINSVAGEELGYSEDSENRSNIRDRRDSLMGVIIAQAAEVKVIIDPADALVPLSFTDLAVAAGVVSTIPQ